MTTSLSGLADQFRYLRGTKQFQRFPLKTIFKLAAWKAHCFLSREATIILVRGSSLKIILPPAWHGSSKLCYALGWEHDDDLVYLAAKASPGSVIVDVGANIGVWTLLLSSKVGPDGRVISRSTASGMPYQIGTRCRMRRERFGSIATPTLLATHWGAPGRTLPTTLRTCTP